MDFDQEETWILTDSLDIQIKFIGVWDTVGRVGDSAEFLNTGVRRQNDFCFHALAIDEYRAAFAPTLWTKEVKHGVREDPPPRLLSEVEQRWFVGAHSNVGGGCDSDTLVESPFLWILEKAEQHGLELRPRQSFQGDFRGIIDPSYGKFFGGAYPFYSR